MEIDKIIISITSLLAIFISGLSLMLSFRTQNKTLRFSVNTLKANKEIENNKELVKNITNEIAEFLLLSYRLNQQSLNARVQQKYFSQNDDDADIQDAVEILYHKIILKLNPNNIEDKELLDEINVFRKCSLGEWIIHRQLLIEATSKFIIRKWSEIDKIIESH